MRVSTYERHESLIRTHLVPALGRIKLKALTSTHVRALHREKLDASFAPATVRKIHSTLHKALSQAVSDGLVPRNIVGAPQFYYTSLPGKENQPTMRCGSVPVRPAVQ